MNESGEVTFEHYTDESFMALKYNEADFPNTYPALPFTNLAKVETEPTEVGYFGSFMPNLHFGVFSNLIHFIISNPVAPGLTTTQRAQFLASDAATSPELLEARRMIARGFVAAGSEDGRITEAVQKARQSPVYQRQYFSPRWDVMHHRFTRWVMRQMTDTRSPPV